MTPEEIIEGNKLIAEFMGFIAVTMKTAEHPNGAPYHMRKDHTGYEPIQYHTSWDWLMPVVEKIEKSNFDGYVFNYNITGDGVCISRFDDGSGTIASIHNEWGESKLIPTWKCVVEAIKFINYYKQDNQTNP